MFVLVTENTRNNILLIIMISRSRKQGSKSPNSRIKFPQLFKFNTYCFLRRAPRTIELIIEQAENIEEFNKLLKNISNRDIKKIQECTKESTRIYKSRMVQISEMCNHLNSYKNTFCQERRKQ